MAAHGDDDLDIRNLIRNQLAATIGNKTSAPMGGNQATVQAGGVGSSARKKKPTRPQPEKRRPDARAEEESRRAKQRRVASPPVPEGLSSPSFLAGNVNAQDFLSQDLTSEAGQGMLSRMSSAQKWSFFCEFQVRAVAMAQSIVMQPNGEADGLRRQLAEQEKSLQETLAALTDAQTSNSKYQAEMDRRGRVADDLALKVQRLELALKTETDKVTALGKGLDAEKTAFEAYKEKARAKVLSQHQAGFAQAARQACHFGDFPPDFHLDMTKDFFQGKLVDLTSIPPDQQADEEAPARANEPNEDVTIQEEEAPEAGPIPGEAEVVS